MNNKFIYQSVHEKTREEYVNGFEEQVREMSRMNNLTLTDADPSPTGGMLFLAHRGSIESLEYIVWNCHHGDALTNGYYTNDVWDAYREYEERQGR